MFSLVIIAVFASGFCLDAMVYPRVTICLLFAKRVCFYDPGLLFLLANTSLRGKCLLFCKF